jgi:uncharacterized membrane protein
MFLSDGVFAIAMTLLVVELSLPSGIVTDADLTRALFSLGPKYFSFALSFAVIATYWVSHQRIFRHLIRGDATLVMLNLSLLLCIAFQPFPTSVLGTYSTPASVTLYAATLFVTGCVVLALWVYATAGRRLVHHDLNRRMVQHQTLRAACVPLVFLISIPIAQSNPSAAEYSWVSIAILLSALRWWYRDAR